MHGKSAKISKERKSFVIKKPRVLRAPPPITDLLRKLANLRGQTRSFFINERGLCSSGLNPKLPVDTAVVIAKKVEEIWWKCSQFKTTNTTLDPQTHKDLLHMYFKRYGKVDMTNNKFMAWLVKGYIAERMGLPVDWATAVASKSLTLASRLEREISPLKSPTNSSGWV